MLRRDLLKVLGLSFVPVPGLVLGPLTHARITASFKGQELAGAPIDFRLNSTMAIKLEIGRDLTLDGCELYRDGDEKPFLKRDFLPIVLTRGCILELSWLVSVEQDLRRDRVRSAQELFLKEVANDGVEPTEEQIEALQREWA